MNKQLVVIGSVLFVLAIVLGAFGAHGLKSIVTPERIQTFEVGVRYQFFVSLALLTVALNADKFQFSLRMFSRFELIGISLFSGSIYLLTLSDLLELNTKWIGPLTPLGGLLMIIGWVIFIVRLIRS